MNLSDDVRNFILNWSEMSTHWGFNRTEALIHSLLFISPNPLTMEEIADTLNVARSNVSNSIKELQRWRIVEVINIMGDRRKHYTAVKDVWELFRNVISEQKRREIDPFLKLTSEAKNKLEQKKSNDEVERHSLEQLGKLVEFFDTTMAWYGQLHSMPTARIRQYLKLGNNLRRLLGKE